MTAMEWDSQMEIGDCVVDAQHESLYRLFNELETAQDAPAAIMRALDHLAAYVAMHFATEEDLMTREDYPEGLVTTHVAEHRQLTQDTRDLVLRFRAGEITSTEQVAEFLREWLKSHMQKQDRVLVEYVRARGGAARAPEEKSTNSPASVSH